MKKLNLSAFAAIAVMSFVILNGCIKNTPIEPAKPVSYVSVMNIALKAPAVELLFNGEKVTPPINPGAYFTRFSSIEPGIRNVVFKKASSDSVVAELPPGQLYDSSSFYTVLLYDNPSGGALGARIKEAFPAADATKTHIRFFQLSADMPHVDLSVDNTKLFLDRTPADNISNPSLNLFQAYAPGSYTLKATVAGTDSVIATTSFNDLVAGGIYTIFLRGVKGGSAATGFAVEVLRATN